jgi:hypothetical protein
LEDESNKHVEKEEAEADNRHNDGEQKLLDSSHWHDA